MLARVACLALACLLAGCVTTMGPEMEMLAKPGQDASFRAPGPVAVDGNLHLAAGRYVADASNALGTFYRGPGHCFVMRIADDQWVAYQGGIWIPAAQAQQPRLFTYIGYPRRYKSLAAALADAAPGAADSASAVPALTAPAMHGGGSLAATGAAAGLMEGWVLMEQKKHAGKEAWVVTRGAPATLPREVLARSVVWDGGR